MKETQKMSITIREALEAIAIISAMIAVIAVPNPADAAKMKPSIAVQYSTGEQTNSIGTCLSCSQNSCYAKSYEY